MNKREFDALIDFELFDGDIKSASFIRRLRIKHFSPPTNFVYLCRKMWFYHSKQKHLLAKYYYLRIYHKYSCCVFPDALIGKGLKVFHPLGIVIGHCIAGENLSVLQGVTIGEKNIGEYKRDNICPHIGDNVTLGANSCILGGVTIVNNIEIGENSVVINDLTSPGTYVGAPAKSIKGI